MNTVSSNGARSQSRTPSPNTEVIEKPKRRRFSAAEKLRILREADTCAPGTIFDISRILFGSFKYNVY